MFVYGVYSPGARDEGKTKNAERMSTSSQIDEEGRCLLTRKVSLAQFVRGKQIQTKAERGPTYRGKDRQKGRAKRGIGNSAL
jgi:hypothetical protein